jgi:superfamily II DNA or RNA helicase
VTTVFEVGALVQARGREWVVLPQSESPKFLVLRPLGGGDDEIAGVFPKLEDVRAACFEAPDPADVGNAVSAGLLRTALRVGFRASAGPFRSMAKIAVEPRAYQLVPLLMALRQETVRLLISDDVGIGKTVEAGLIAAELLEQGDATGLAVLCGPALAEQWQGELRTKFGIHAELVLPGTIRRLQRGLLQGETLFDRYPHVVVSTDFIKQPGLREQFWTKCPDLLIIDEAHTCVSDGTGGRSRMLRHELVNGLAKNDNRHLILVTATPHSGKEDGFRNLLALLATNLEHVDLESVQGRERLARYFVQRRRADIRSFLDESTPFPEDRLTQERSYTLSKDYKALFEDVLGYARETIRDDDGGKLRQRVRYWSALALLRALASSPKAAAATLTTRAANLDAADEAEADRLGRSAVMDLPDEETVESADATPGADPDNTEGDTSHRRRLRRFAARAEQLTGKPDTKLKLLGETVTELLLEGYNPVVFCRFIDTAEYVAEHLAQRLDAKSYAVAAVTGTLPPDERIARINELAADAKRRPVLIATDCLSEGVNLQQHFQAVVHYDLAWNPTRHEQREGRVDRFGQTARTVRAVTIYGTDNGIDGIVLDVLLRKHEQIRKALGISVPVPDRSDDVVEAILEGLLLRDAAGEQLAFEGVGLEKRTDLHREWESTAAAERQSRTKYAQAGIQPGEVAAELDRMRASLGTPAEVGDFTREALSALRADITSTHDGFRASTGPLPDGLRDGLFPGHAEPLPFHKDLPVLPREAYLDRTDPNVAAIARYVLESALDDDLNAALRPARRCGVMRTSEVARRTTLLLVRFRMHLELPGRDDRRQVVAEDAQVLAFRGRAAEADWLTAAEVQVLLNAQPTGNVPPDQRLDWAERTVADLPLLRPRLDEEADALAERLRDDHIRVREAGGQRVRRQISVRAQKPADILGVYVYLPDARGGAA